MNTPEIPKMKKQWGKPELWLLDTNNINGGNNHGTHEGLFSHSTPNGSGLFIVHKHAGGTSTRTAPIIGHYVS